jgi:hypothetical protein
MVVRIMGEYLFLEKGYPSPCWGLTGLSPLRPVTTTPRGGIMKLNLYGAAA